ncbi:MAG: hydroxyethylthiazole kinase [Candidatus Sumerlaeota bacterium]|nr:hydroxyethylthiazole kinase [Candidatus Sumerlaeota bacterium]
MGKDFILGDQLEAVRARAPLVHNITNYVAMNWIANGLLALGASPVMAHAESEMRDMAGIASALVVNIGTLSEPWIASMKTAMRAARERGIPIVLDPVGAGASVLRTNTARELAFEFSPAILRGNASEIAAVAGEAGRTKGVDSTRDSAEAGAIELARDLARRTKAVVCVSGAVDVITDGERVYLVRNGDPMMTKVTAMGCLCSAVVGAFAAVGGKDLLASTANAMALMGVTGEIAKERAAGPGSFAVAFLDALAEITRSDLEARARMEWLRP